MLMNFQFWNAWKWNLSIFLYFCRKMRPSQRSHTTIKRPIRLLKVAGSQETSTLGTKGFVGGYALWRLIFDESNQLQIISKIFCSATKNVNEMNPCIFRSYKCMYWFMCTKLHHYKHSTLPMCISRDPKHLFSCPWAFLPL